MSVLQSRLTNTVTNKKTHLDAIDANDNVNSPGTERQIIAELKKKPIAV